LNLDLEIWDPGGEVQEATSNDQDLEACGSHRVSIGKNTQLVLNGMRKSIFYRDALTRHKTKHLQLGAE
jgi:hypothetical protein